jgi:putative acetyltransferase
VNIREERASDSAAIRAVHRAAFEADAEAALVDALREQAAPLVSLVADEGGAVVGHILFSPVVLSGDDSLKIMGLAPMSVLPAHQRRGVGTALVQAALERCRELGFAAVVVLGHAEYYPRFGFVPASRFGLRSEYDVPDDVFMAMELIPGALTGRSGTICYHPAFAKF